MKTLLMSAAACVLSAVPASAQTPTVPADPFYGDFGADPFGGGTVVPGVRSPLPGTGSPFDATPDEGFGRRNRDLGLGFGAGGTGFGESDFALDRLPGEGSARAGRERTGSRRRRGREAGDRTGAGCRGDYGRIESGRADNFLGDETGPLVVPTTDADDFRMRRSGFVRRPSRPFDRVGDAAASREPAERFDPGATHPAAAATSFRSRRYDAARLTGSRIGRGQMRPEADFPERF